MIDEALVKSNFIGRDGFRWWIGQIPPLSTMGKQTSGSGWGNRYKVRIMGYHPANSTELKDEDLPWAICMLPTTSGTGGANLSTSVKLTQGDTVFGFFLDGDDAQIPVIMGAIGHTNYKVSGEPGPFKPFTGYSDQIKNNGARVVKNESNEKTSKSQKSPRLVSEEKAKAIGGGPEENTKKPSGEQERSFFSAIGETTQGASASTGKTLDKISTAVENFINKINALNSDIAFGINKAKRDIDIEIDKVTKYLAGIVTGMVSSMVNTIFKKMAPILKQGLKLLYRLVYNLVLAATGNPVAAHTAGVAAQNAMVIPIKILQDKIPTVANYIINSIASVIKGMLKSMVNNIANFVTCVADQFIGSLVNNIIGKIANTLKSAIDGIQKITQFFGGFSVKNLLNENPLAIAGGIPSPLSCGEKAEGVNGQVLKWVIGKGPKNAPELNAENIIKLANTAASLVQTTQGAVGTIQEAVGAFTIFTDSIKTPNLKSALGSCYAGPPLNCGAPTINIFGGEGIGAAAVPIMGALVGEGLGRTASIIGVKITNPASGYEFPPFIEVVDNCNKGYGAQIRATLTPSGSVEEMYVISEGEGYPVGEVDPYVVDRVIVVDGGTGYEDGDIVTDNLGNQYKAKVFQGTIIEVESINKKEITDLPVIEVISNTGTGAILKPVLDFPTPGPVKKQIDCITK